MCVHKLYSFVFNIKILPHFRLIYTYSASLSRFTLRIPSEPVKTGYLGTRQHAARFDQWLLASHYTRLDGHQLLPILFAESKRFIEKPTAKPGGQIRGKYEDIKIGNVAFFTDPGEVRRSDTKRN